MKCQNIQNLPITDLCISSGPNAPDWTLLTIDQPFYEPETNTFRVVVPQSKIPKNDEEILQESEKGKLLAVESLIKNFEKIDNEQNRQLLLSNIIAIDVFIPFRQILSCPDLGTKYLYSVDFDIFSQLGYDENPSLPPAEKEFVLDAFSLKQDLFKLSSILESINKDEGETIQQSTGVNFEKQINKINSFFSVLSSFVTENGLIFSEEPFLINNSMPIRGAWYVFGVDSNNMLKYVLVESEKKTLRLRCKIDKFKKFWTPTLSVFLMNIDKLTQTKNYGESLFNLLSSAANLTIPNVNLSIAGQSINLLSSPKRSKNSDKKTEEDKKINDDTFLERVETKIQKNISQEFDARFGFLENINSLEDAYNLLLNRTDFKCFLGAAAECLINNLEGLGVDENTIRCEMVKAYLKSVEVDTFLQTIKDLNVQIEQLPTMNLLIRQKFIDCYNSLNEKNKQDLNSGLSLRSGIVFNNIEEIENYTSEKLIEGFGYRSKSILIETYVQEKNKIIDELIDVVGCDAFANLTNGSYTGLSLANSAFDAIRQLDICDLDFSLNLPFPFLNFTFNWSDLFPTWDELAAFIEALIVSIITALLTAILDFIKSLLTLSLSICDGDGIAGIYSGLNDGSILRRSLAAGLGISLGELNNIDLGKVIAERLNLIPNLQISQNFTNFANDLNRFLGDLGAILTPGELVRFLNGQVTDDVRELLECLIGGSSSALQGANLSDLGSGLGSLIDKTGLLEQVKTFVDETQEKCDDVMQNIRYDILKNKGVNEDLIKKQLMNARARKLQQLAKIAEQIENKDFQNVVPNIFCGPNGAGLTTQNPRSVQFMMEKTINTIFDGIKTSFDNDIKSFPEAVYDFVNKQKNIKKFRKIENKTYITPEWQRLVAQGYPDEIRDNDGKVDLDATDNPDREQIIFEPSSKNVVAQGLLNIYKNLDSNLQTTQNGFIVKIPTPTDNNLNQFSVQALQNVNLQQIKNLNGNSFDLSGISQQDFNEISQNIVNNNLQPHRFGMEYNYLNSCEPLDRFNFSYFYENINDSERNYIHFKEYNKEVTSSIQNVINKYNLNNSNGLQPPHETYFQDYVSNLMLQHSSFSEPLKIKQHVKNALKDGRFYSIFENLIKLLGNRISQSPIFNKETLSSIDWAPPQIPGCDPSLLSLNDIKKNIKKRSLENECMEDDFPNTNPYEPKLGSMEKNSLFELVFMIYRLYVIEYILKTIFIFGEFNNLEDDLTLIFVREEFKKDIKQFGENYYNDIINTTLMLWKQENSGEIEEDQLIEWAILPNIKDVKIKLSAMVAAPEESLNLNKYFLSTNIPLLPLVDEFDIDISPRFFDVSVKQNKINKSFILNNNQEIENLNINEGTFFLEKYARVKYKDSFTARPNYIRNNGVVSFKLLSKFTRSQNIPIQEIFEEIKIGMRLNYLLPPSDFQTVYSSDNSIFQNIIKENPNSVLEVKQKEKCFFVKETYRENNLTYYRNLNIIPLVSHEIETEIKIDDVNEPGLIYETFFELEQETFFNEIIEKNEFKFIFDYSFSIKRAISILSMISIGYLSSKTEIDVLFDITKSNLKRTFYSIKNSGVSDYQDPLVSNGIPKLTEDFNTKEPDIVAMIIKFILATPLRILKGLVEITDPNIKIAKLIADTSRIFCKPIPIEIASLAQLPINVVVPGYGPPISPLGFVYLATQAYDSIDFPSCKQEEKELVNKNILRGEKLSLEICRRLQRG